ncbi:unnamed protein product, partial [marine sediment metagenome]
MPYFVPTPSDAQWLYWIRPLGQPQMISQWPKPNAARVPCRFRFIVDGEIVWTAGRWFVQYFEGGVLPDYLSRGWLDLAVVGPGHLFGSAGLNAEGWVATLDVQRYEGDPLFGLPGVVAILKWERVSPPRVCEQTFTYLDKDATRWLPNTTLDSDHASWTTAISDGYPVGAEFLGFGGGLSDCYDFPEIEAPVGGFARMNGSDSYVSFPTFFSNHGPRWKAEWEVRPRVNAEMPAFVFTGFTSFFSGHDNIADVRWWNKIIPVSPNLVLDVWNEIRLEYNWSIPGATFEAWVNGSKAGSLASAPQLLPMDNIGWLNGIGPGDFDLRNFKLTDGTPVV